MPVKKIEKSNSDDLFRSRLENIIHMRHELVILSKLIDWQRIEKHYAPFYKDKGRNANAIRLMVGLHLLKHMRGLSDENVCEEWRENPYMQYFCGEEYFCSDYPIERSGMSHFRDRVGAEALEILLQESLAAAQRAGAISHKDTRAVAVDTTVAEKSITHPTQHGLLLTALEHLVAEAKEAQIPLRQTYLRVAKTASIKASRYIHAKQMKRAKREIKFIKARLGRVLRDIHRKCKNIPHSLQIAIDKAIQIKHQNRGDEGYIYSWHAPEVECIGKGKARKPYEFGCKASLATNLMPAKGGHFILHAQALHGNPYDGHTLADALYDIKDVVGVMPNKVAVDKGYRGHGITNKDTEIFITGQKRGVTEAVKRWLKRRAVIEPVIGHAKNDGLLGKNYLKGTEGDKINVTLAATGFNLRQILRYIRILWLYFICQLLQKILIANSNNPLFYQKSLS